MKERMENEKERIENDKGKGRMEYEEQEENIYESDESYTS